ncbi:MAG: hypothetical protein WCX82_02530 [archaeon]|jgi:hypothetical protein
MFKKILVILLLTLALNLVVADKIDSINFSELGYGNLKVSENTNLCKIYDFKKLNQTTETRLFSNIIIENYIPIKDDLNLSIYLNDNLQGVIFAKDLVASNYLELTGKLNENNQLKLCVENFVLPLVIISNRSTVGTYLIGEIKPAEFYQKVLTTERYNNVLIPIEIYAENNSPKTVTVNIIYADDIFLKNSNLETVSGETNYSGEILPGETKVLKYFLKANKTISFATPQAKLTYIDEFKNTKTIYAKQEKINLVENQNKIEVYIDTPRDVIINEPTQGKIIIKNVSESDIENITIETNFDNKITLSKRQIEMLNKYAVEEIPFEIITDEIGKHTLNATIYYNVGNTENGVSAQLITINTDIKKDYVKEMIGVFLLITILIYVWIVRL